jgi:hypothetical protein
LFALLGDGGSAASAPAPSPVFPPQSTPAASTPWPGAPEPWVADFGGATSSANTGGCDPFQSVSPAGSQASPASSEWSWVADFDPLGQAPAPPTVSAAGGWPQAQKPSEKPAPRNAGDLSALDIFT